MGGQTPLPGLTPPMLEAVHAFLLGFPALFSIVNPISGALIFRSVTAEPPSGGPSDAGQTGGTEFAGRDDGRALGRVLSAGVLRDHPGGVAGRRRPGRRLERLAPAERTGNPRESETGAGRLGRGDGGHRIVSADNSTHDRPRHDIRGGRAWCRSSQVVRRARLVLPWDDRGGSGDDRDDLGHLPLCRSADPR